MHRTSLLLALALTLSGCPGETQPKSAGGVAPAQRTADAERRQVQRRLDELAEAKDKEAEQVAVRALRTWLGGILVNDSIILVSRLDERLAAGDTLFDAAVGASRDRLRAVLLTSLTTIGGLLPLLFEKSLQAQFLLPMAITIVFGLAAATALVLFLVPTLVGIGADIGRLGRGLAGRRPHDDTSPQPPVPAA